MCGRRGIRSGRSGDKAGFSDDSAPEKNKYAAAGQTGGGIFFGAARGYVLAAGGGLYGPGHPVSGA